MRKFKIFFYPIYIIIILVTLYFSIDFLNRMMTDRDAFYSFLMKEFGLSSLPLYGTIIFLVISVFMMIGLIVENIHIVSLSRKLNKSEKELLTLKAKMYDSSQQPSSIEGIEDDEIEEDEEAND